VYDYFPSTTSDRLECKRTKLCCF